MQVISHVQHT